VISEQPPLLRILTSEKSLTYNQVQHSRLSRSSIMSSERGEMEETARAHRSVHSCMPSNATISYFRGTSKYHVKTIFKLQYTWPNESLGMIQIVMNLINFPKKEQARRRSRRSSRSHHVSSTKMLRMHGDDPKSMHFHLSLCSNVVNFVPFV